MFRDDEDKVTVHRRKLTPEMKELQRIDNERWAKAEKEADERIAARKASPPPQAASR
jgi:hypothetical protein